MNSIPAEEIKFDTTNGSGQGVLSPNNLNSKASTLVNPDFTALNTRNNTANTPREQSTRKKNATKKDSQKHIVNEHIIEVINRDPSPRHQATAMSISIKDGE